MADKKPNSVLFSLKELRRIEDDRVEQEETSKKQQEESERMAKEQAEREAVEAEERKVQEEQDRIRAEQDEKERQQREGELRLQESERQARIQAEMELQRAREEAAIKAKALEKKVPWVPIGIAIAVLVAAIAGLGYYSFQQKEQEKIMQAELAKKRAEHEKFRAEMDEKERLHQELEEKLAQQKRDLEDKLSAAKDDAEKDLLRKQLAEQRDKAASLRSSRARQRAAAKKRAKKLSIGDTSDPIHGL